MKVGDANNEKLFFLVEDCSHTQRKPQLKHQVIVKTKHFFFYVLPIYSRGPPSAVCGIEIYYFFMLFHNHFTDSLRGLLVLFALVMFTVNDNKKKRIQIVR